MATLYENVQTLNPTTGSNVVLDSGNPGDFIIMNPATDIAALTITYPSTPYEGQRVAIVFTHKVSALTVTGGAFNYVPVLMPAGGYLIYRYDPLNATWMDVGHDTTVDMASIRGKTYDVTTTSGTVVIYLTKDGLSTGAALFSAIDFVNARFVSNDPNFGVSYILSADLKTLTLTAVKQTFTGITLLSTNVLGSVAISATANGTALKVYVTGKLNP